MISRKAFNVIAEELDYAFAQEYGEKYHGIVVVDSYGLQNDDLTDDLLYIADDQKIVVNYSRWAERYPYVDLDEYKSFIEEEIRKEILDTNIMQG